jgi:Domain of unknown function (DUF397)
MTTDFDPALLTKDLAAATWKSASSGGQTCVEVAVLNNNTIAIRDSKDTSGPALTFPASTYTAFLEAVRDSSLAPKAR